MSSNSEHPPLDWSGSIESNITFFRDQSKLLGNAYNPSQVANGAILTIIIMNHNMIMGQLAVINQRLDKIEKLLTCPPSNTE